MTRITRIRNRIGVPRLLLSPVLLLSVLSVSSVVEFVFPESPSVHDSGWGKGRAMRHLLTTCLLVSIFGMCLAAAEAEPQVDQPHKVRVTMAKAGPFLLVAGKTAALLTPGTGPREKGKLPTFTVVPFDLGDANHLRFVDECTPLVSRRFGGFYSLDHRKFVPEIDGPYVDFRLLGDDLLTSYGQ